jgi:hypothetical protein
VASPGHSGSVPTFTRAGEGVLATVPDQIRMSPQLPGRGHIMLLVVLIRDGAWPAFVGSSNVSEDSLIGT